MVKKIFLKFIHFTVILILFIFTLVLLINVFSKNLINNYINNKFIEGINVNVGKVSKTLIPFYIELSDVVVTTDEFELVIKDVSLDVSIKRYLQNKPFISAKIKSPYITILKHGNKSDDFDISTLRYLSFIKELSINNFVYEDKVNNLLIRDESLLLNSKKYKKLYLENIKVKKGGIESNISDIIADFAISEKTLQVKKLIANGEDIKLDLNGLLNEDTYSGKFYVFLDEGFFKILNPHLSGQLSLKGESRDGIFQIDVITNNIKYRNEMIKLLAKIEGDKSKITYRIKQLAIGNKSFKSKGWSDFRKIKGEFEALNEFFIYKDKKFHFLLKRGKYELDLVNFFGILELDVESDEKYKVVSNFKYFREGLIFEKFKILSQTASLMGNGTYLNKEVKFSLSGNVKNNSDLKKVLDINHNLDVTIKVKYQNDKINLKASFNEKDKTKYHNLVLRRLRGSLNYDGNALEIFTEASIEDGTLILNGIMDKNGESFDIYLKNVKFSNVLKYFDVQTKIDNKVDGKVNVLKADNDIYVIGEVSKIESLEKTKILFEYRDKKLLFTDLIYDKFLYKDVGYIDFKTNSVKASIKEDQTFCLFDKLCLDSFSVNINGKLNNPEISSRFEGNYERNAFGGRIDGNLKLLHGVVKLKGKDVFAELFLKELKLLTGSINIQKYKVNDDIEVSSIINLESNGLKVISLSSYLSLIYYKNEEITLRNLKGEFKNNKLYINSGTIDSRYIKKVKIKMAQFDKDNCKLILLPQQLNLEDKLIANFRGDIILLSDYKNVDLTTDLNGNGSIYLPEYGVDLDILYLNISILNKELKANLFAKKIDEKVIVSVSSIDYLDISKFKILVNGENIFVSKSGFAGTLSYSLEKKADSRLVKGDIFVNKSVFDFKKMNKVSNNKNGAIDLPFDIDVEINTVNPTILKDKFVDAKANINLKIEYKDKKFEVSGKIESFESYLILAGERFYVEDGYLLIDKNKPPYIYTKASGSGNFNNLFITVYGYLPEYTIFIEDLNPNSSESIYNRSEIRSKNVISSFFTGTLLRELTRYTEKIFGINRIGLEETSVSGSQMKDYFKIGRKFSDRFEVKYLVDTDGAGSDYLTGEYLIFDWLKLNVNYSNLEGAGAGITFFINY